jgi:hypothetical protein
VSPSVKKKAGKISGKKSGGKKREKKAGNKMGGKASVGLVNCKTAFCWDCMFSRHLPAGKKSGKKRPEIKWRGKRW